MTEINRIKLLIVDDREENIFAMEALLEDDGIEILKANSGNECLGLLLEHEVAVILLDVQMPGMNGFETAELIRGSSKTRHVPIIFVTAISKERTLIFKGYESGAVDYLFKPIEPNILKSKVRVFIELHRQKQTLESITHKLENTISELIESRKSLRLSEEKSKEAQKIAEEANKAKSGFLANMSHEIRTPLNGIIGMAELVLLSKLTPEQKDKIDTIRQSGESLLEILNEILDLSKIEAEKIELEDIEFNLSEEIEKVSRMLSVKIFDKNLEFIINIDPKLPAFLHGDPLRLRQVLLNLLSNALKFTDHGEITLFAKLISSKGNSVHVRFEVNDTGIGIPAEKLDKLFQNFNQVDSSTTRQYGGTGLGLSISRKLIDLMQGKIWVESIKGQGSSFIFELDYKNTSDKKESPKLPAEDISGFSPVWIIAQNNSIAQNVDNCLQHIGLSDIHRQDGTEALDLLNNKEDKPGCIIIDYQLAEINGIELGKKISSVFRENTINNTTIVLMIPDSVQVSRDELHNAGIHFLLSKPLFADNLRQALLSINHKELVSDDKLVKDQSRPEETRSLKILLAEDNPINTKLVQGFIKFKKWEVDAAKNGLEALVLFKANKYDLVLMDISMPVMDGLDSTMKIRQWESVNKLDHTPIIALSAHAMQGDIDKAIASGMDNYLTKPFKSNDLYQMINKLT